MKTYNVPMSPIVIAGYYLFMALVAGAVTWSFRSGINWTAICLLAVAVPIGALFFYMLIAVPRRNLLGVSEQGILIQAMPLLKAAVPFDAITRTFRSNVRSDEALRIKETRKIVHWASYRVGLVVLENGREAYLVTTGDEVFGIETEDIIFLLGPKDLDGFVAEVASFRE